MSQITGRDFQGKSGKTIQIRNPVPSDAAAILILARGVMAEGIYTLTRPEELSQTEEQEKDWIQSMNENPTSLLLIAEVEGQIVGMLDFAVGRRQRIAHQGEFGISVHRDFREMGIGKALMTGLLDWAQAIPAVEKICLRVRTQNLRAISLYQKLGFIEEGRLIKDLKDGPGQYADTLLMGKFVKPI